MHNEDAREAHKLADYFLFQPLAAFIMEMTSRCQQYRCQQYSDGSLSSAVEGAVSSQGRGAVNASTKPWNSERCWFQNSRGDRGQFFFWAEVVLQIIIWHLGGTFSIIMYLYLSVKYCNACYFNVTLIWQKNFARALSVLPSIFHFILLLQCEMWKRALNKCTVDRWLFGESLVSFVTIVFLLSCFCWDAQNVFFKSSLAAFYHLTMLTVPISPKRNAVDQVLWKHFQ